MMWADSSAQAEPSRTPAEILRVTRLAVHFGGLRAIEDLSFEARESEIFGLIGPNGAGKTTCFNAISGAVRPASGDVLYRGERVTGLRPYEMARRGVVRTFQLTSLFGDLTAEENVIIGSHLRRRGGLLGALAQSKRCRDDRFKARAEAREILEFVGIGQLGERRPSSLSFGEQRRLEIAIALAAGPTTLLLDEPAAGMNPAEAIDLMHLVRAIRDKGITVLLIEHNMRFVMGLCDRVIVLDYGAKIAEGSPSEIAANAEVREVYLGRDDGDA